jgi:hypothetical protein
MVAAIEASRLHHSALAELEAAHIRQTLEPLFNIQARVAMALRERDLKLADLLTHQRTTHGLGRSTGASGSGSGRED